MGAKKGRRPADQSGKLARDNAVSVYLDARLRYLLELAARKQRRATSNFIEWAIEDSLAKVLLRESTEGKPATSLATESVQLWDADESVRFGRLATSFPELLSHHEEKVWNLVRRNNHYWRTDWMKIKPGTGSDLLLYDRLRAAWDDLKAVASGERDESCLPKAHE